jgi:hypothetical protein
MVCHIVIDRRRFIAALRAADRYAGDGRDEIEHELAEVIADFCDRWLGKKLRTRHYNRASSLTAASSLRNIIRKYEKTGK